MAPGSFSGMMLLLEKAAGEDILDPMDLHRDIRAGKTRDIGDRRDVPLLEIRNHDLPVQWFEFEDEMRKLLERPGPVKLRLRVPRPRGFDLLQADQPLVDPALPVDVGHRGVMSHPEGPGLQRAASVERLE